MLAQFLDEEGISLVAAIVADLMAEQSGADADLDDCFGLFGQVSSFAGCGVETPAEDFGGFA